MLMNPILQTDSYKLTHWKMLPEDLTAMGSYLEARTGGEFDEVVFFGLNYFLRLYLEGYVVQSGDVGDAEEFCKAHFGQNLFNVSGWLHIVKDHNGRLPLEIRAVPEGTVVPTGNVLMTIQNTCQQCAWLVNHFETLLVQLWYPCTVATISRHQKKFLSEGLTQTTGDTEGIDYMLHDFGYRGSSSPESAALGGAAHLVNFKGSDNIAGIGLLQECYGAKMPAYSVPAAEHSTITMYGKDNEAEAYERIMDAYPDGIVSIVSDSYDIFNACRNIFGQGLWDDVYSVDEERTVVIRPDSGSPFYVVPKVLEILGERFGYRMNRKGFKCLPQYLKVLQGDGIDRRSLPYLMEILIRKKWSVDNMVFGSGGGLLQDCNRDTLRFALKCSWADIDGSVVNVYKDPATDSGKASKSGHLKLIRDAENGNQYRTVSYDPILEDADDDVLETVFKDGVVTVHPTLDEIRERTALANG